MYVYLSNRPHFLWVYRRDNPSGMLGEHEKKLVNHEPKASDLQAFRVWYMVYGIWYGMAVWLVDSVELVNQKFIFYNYNVNISNAITL